MGLLEPRPPALPQYVVVEMTRGRVFFTAGRDLDRYVIWNYVKNRRTIVA